MKRKNMHSSPSTNLALAISLLFFAVVAHTQPNNKTEQAIQHLLSRIAGSSLIFIRNNETHPAQDAAEHINNKYQHFKDEIKTAEDFIEKCATKSLLSGRYYQVIDKQGNKIRTHDWLMAELETYRRNHP